MPREPSPGDHRDRSLQLEPRRDQGWESLQPCEPAVKRRKTQLACDECRNKKIKCDGVRPSKQYR